MLSIALISMIMLLVIYAQCNLCQMLHLSHNADVGMLNVIMMSVIMMSVIIMSVIMSVITMSVIMMSVIMMSVIMMSVIMMSVIKWRFTAPHWYLRLLT